MWNQFPALGCRFPMPGSVFGSWFPDPDSGSRSPVAGSGPRFPVASSLFFVQAPGSESHFATPVLVSVPGAGSGFGSWSPEPYSCSRSPVPVCKLNESRARAPRSYPVGGRARGLPKPSRHLVPERHGDELECLVVPERHGDVLRGTSASVYGLRQYLKDLIQIRFT